MSLVAYAASSGDESSSETEDNASANPQPSVVRIPPKVTPIEHGDISDEDDDFMQQEVPLQDLHKSKPPSVTLSLPQPKHNAAAKSLIEQLEEDLTPTFAKLPMPKQATTEKVVIPEEDDEFLHKKALPLDKESLEKPPPPKGPVKISIPAMKEFRDVDKDLATSKANSNGAANKAKGCSLLSILPQAKSEQNFARSSNQSLPKGETPSNPSRPLVVPSLIPDTVKNRRPAYNTEGVDGIRTTPARKPQKPAVKPKVALVNCSGSESSDEEGASKGDFFALHKDEDLPEVSVNELNAMVAKRAAKMAGAAENYLDSMAAKEAGTTEEPMDAEQEEELRQAQKRYHEQYLDETELNALAGSGAKRMRKQKKDIEVLELSSDQVLPNREEWMRTALATSTQYQPTGVLNDEEPAAGTRRKHQITYLAHKAKSNEAELQAMWATNRQNRRATQSKYGF